jgi:transposase-like protein
VGDTLLMATSTWPKTLQEAIVYFADPDVAFAEMVKFRWPDGVVKCPTCGSENVYFTKSRRIWQCKEDHAKRQFSVKIGSIMEDSPLSIDKWLVALWLICNAKNGISSYELGRAIGVTQKSAWFMLHRIRLAMQDKSTGGKLSGEVEVDETFIGGKARNMHKGKLRRLSLTMSTPMVGKAAVMGLLERSTEKGKSPSARREQPSPPRPAGHRSARRSRPDHQQ